METSTTIAELAKALSKFQSEVENVTKDGTNPFFRSRYATLENCWDTIRAALGANGLALTQFPCGENEMASMLVHVSGEWIVATAKMTPKDATPQGQGSAITFLRRYTMCAILGLATTDDDGEAATHPTPKTAPKRSTAPPSVPTLDNSQPFYTEEEVRQADAISDVFPEATEEPKRTNVPNGSPLKNCARCDSKVPQVVEAFSMKKFGRVWCRGCQKLQA